MIKLAFDKSARRVDADGRLHIDKACTKCKKVKPLSDFNKRKKSMDGLQHKCRECTKSEKKKWDALNADHVREYTKTYGQQYRAKNKEVLTQKKREYYIANAGAIIEKVCTWQKDNTLKVNVKNAKWRKANPAKCNAKTSRRRAAKFQATPTWADKKAIERIYQEASQMAGYEVDHIVPLNSKIVSGLHVPANLQIIKCRENRSKGNKFWPDMPQ